MCLTSLLTIGAPQSYNYVGSHQPHQQYGSAPAASLKDIQAAVSLQSGPNFAVVQNQVASYVQPNSPLYQAPQPQARYLAPAVVASNAIPAAPIYEAPTLNVAFTNNQYHQQHYQQPAEAIISKRFFIHSAPEEREEEGQEKIIMVGRGRKNYNVVFIKSPTMSKHRASIKIAPAVNEEKTVIYVLAKKNDASEIDAQVHEAVTTTTRPEVYFIKYKTAEEAAHAQQTIQAQYDSLGGSTQITNEGTASVSSVIGVLDAAKQSASAAEATQLAQVEHENQFQQQLLQLQQPEQEVLTSVQSLSQDTTNNGYLPPHRYYY